ncbi:hypothetical protein DICVIV_08536 [Dictyocaulus viviparus]|uniref:Tyrosinase copper-binding domain-containing protein n=1 Tax=Dictyocaulus viviparus TaxID=29172 RepID=A0A0D8XNT8_DICVI|nr:hypothetical protein DICVIV_08536 [Dictyocaulus viviparus]
MGKSHSSSNDAIFLFHHSMIDLIFEAWRQKMQASQCDLIVYYEINSRTERESDYPASDENCFPPWHNIDSIMPMLHPLTNGRALSNGYTDELYEFAPRPNCTRKKPDCGSKYLFCHISEMDGAHCMAKIRLGGKCTGFEGTKICYVGECINGICQNKDRSIVEKQYRNRNDIWLM